MSISFPSSPSPFFGREDYIGRFKSRLEHFRFHLYEGIPGVGKTSLLLRLAPEAKAIGATGAVYLDVYPGESIDSLLARVEARTVGGQWGKTFDSKGDPYARLTDLLSAHKLILLLDDLHKLRRDDFVTMVRVFRAREGWYRVVGTMQGDPELSAVDRSALHHERLGAFSVDEVLALAGAAGITGEALEAIRSDAAHSGSVAHPLTLRFLLALCGGGVTPDLLSDRQSARSVTAFKALFARIEDRIGSGARAVLGGLASVGLPLSEQVVREVFGPAVDDLHEHGLLAEIDGNVGIHRLVADYFAGDGGIPSGGVPKIASALAQHGQTFNEPMACIRGGELLARFGFVEEALEALAICWEAVRDLGYFEAYLKALASLPSEGPTATRLKLLSARARMRQGSHASSLMQEMRSLAAVDDDWTRSQALAALCHMHGNAGAFADVVACYEKLSEVRSASARTLIPAGILAAEAMIRLGRMEQAEKLARALLRQDKKHSGEGELRRLLGRIYGQAGKLAEAVEETQKAAALCEKAGDLYHAAVAYRAIGDYCRQAGEFEQARQAYGHFLQRAQKWGDRDLVHIAELSEAWVCLDVGDLPRAAKRVEAVENELSAAPSRTLKRYFATANALLMIGRGQHDKAAVALAAVVEAWEQRGEIAVADMLRAQQVRSFIACDDLERAQAIVSDTLERLDVKTAAPRVATFLRESALIHLRRQNAKMALDELAQAATLFAKGGNRREEALTLHRIAHAAFEQGDLELASARATETIALARLIKHARVLALALEVRGRVALLEGEAQRAVEYGKEALHSLRRLGDELGALHVSEWLLRAELVAGDVANVLRTGPKVVENAQRLEVRDVRVRAIVLTGVALLRRGRYEAAGKCFRDLPERGFSAWTAALTWRFGEALASVSGLRRDQARRSSKRVEAVLNMPESRREMVARALEQLDLPPRERCRLRTADASKVVGTEIVSLLEPGDYDLYVDVVQKRILHRGREVALDGGLSALVLRAAVVAPEALSYGAALRALSGAVSSVAASVPAGQDPEPQVKAVLKELQPALKAHKLVLTPGDGGVTLMLPKRFVVLTPSWVGTGKRLSDSQKKIVRLLRRYASMSLQTLQDQCALSRAAIRREVGAMVDAGLVETIRAGRGQAYRLA